MQRIARISVAALVALTAAAAQAADFYGGGSIGRSRWSGADVPGFTVDRTDMGGKIFLGAALHPNLSLEGGYATLGQARFSSGAVSGSVKGSGWFADAVGTVPVANNVLLFARLGIFFGKADVSVPGVVQSDDSGTDAKFGVGASYALNPRTAVRVEWERYRFKAFDERENGDLMSVGFSFKF